MDRRFCNGCDKWIKNRWQKKYCSINCQMEYQYRFFIYAWRRGDKDGGIGVTVRATSAHLKKYLCQKFNDRCAICFWSEVHTITGKIPLEIDHIDGNSENNLESNLRLICPNCHSLTANFKNLNKGCGRKWWMDKYIKNQV